MSDERRGEVYVSLSHAHVPKLADEGVINFDEAAETIAAADHVDQMRTALKGVGESLDSEQESHAHSEMEDG